MISKKYEPSYHNIENQSTTNEVFLSLKHYENEAVERVLQCSCQIIAKNMNLSILKKLEKICKI